MLLKLIAITSTLQFVLQVRQYLSVTESYGCHYSNTLPGQIHWLLCPKLQTQQQSRLSWVRDSSPSPSLRGTSPSPSLSPQNKDSSLTRVHCRTRVLHHWFGTSFPFKFLMPAYFSSCVDVPTMHYVMLVMACQ